MPSHVLKTTEVVSELTKVTLDDGKFHSVPSKAWVKQSHEQDIDIESKIRIDLQRKEGGWLGGGAVLQRQGGSGEFLIQQSFRKSLWQNQSLITLTDRPAIWGRLGARQASGCIKIQALRDVGRPQA